MTNPVALHLEEPLSLDEARAASRAMASQRRAAEETLQALVEDAAHKEHAYRKAYADAIVKADGTAEARKALALAECAREAMDRDISAGMVRVQTERLRGLEGERSLLKSLVDWSSRLRLDEQEHIGGVAYGRRTKA